MAKDVAIPKVKGDLAADRGKIQEQSKAIAKALWSGKLTANEQAALNQICAVYKLDPLLRQVVMLGGNVYLTGGALKVIANRDPQYALNGIELYPATDEERKLARVPEESHYWKAIVWKKGSERPFTEFGEANKDNVKLYQADWKAYQDMAKTRAVNRALRNAYAVGFTSLEEMGYAGDSVIQTVEAEVVEPGPEKENTKGEDPPPKPEANSDKMTEPQRAKIFAMGKGLDMDKDAIEAMCQTNFQKKLSELTKTQASVLIEAMQELFPKE